MAGTARTPIVAIAPTPYFSDRGCHVRILDVLDNLQECGGAVTLVTYPLGRDLGRFHICRTLRMPWYRAHAAGPNIHKWYLDLLLLWRVGRAVWQYRPQVLYCFLHEGALLGIAWRLLFNVRVVFDCQGSLTEELIDHRFMRRHGLRHRLFLCLERQLYRRADMIVTSSAALAQWIRAAMPALRTPVVELADAVDTTLFCPRPPDEEVRARIGLQTTTKVVGFMGLLTVYQGIDDFLELAQALCAERADVTFLVIGFPDEEHYRARMTAAGYADRCVFVGRVPYEHIPAYLSLMTVAVSPKRSASEANGKILHFMAMGMPVACYDTPVNRALLGAHGNYAPAGDVRALTAAVRAVLDASAQEQACRRSTLLHYVREQHAWERRRPLMRALLARDTRAAA